MHAARSLAIIAFALVCTTAIPHHTLAAPAAPVVAQELANVRASGKVMTALWTVRKNAYTLQLVFPFQQNAMAPREFSRTGANGVSGKSAQPQAASVQVWLLKADGTQVFQVHGAPPPKPEGLPGNFRTTSYTYTWHFPIEESRQAVAMAIRINDDFYIDQLKPLR